MTDTYAYQPGNEIPSQAGSTDSSPAVGAVEHVAEQASELKDHAGQEIQSLVGTAKEQARDLAGEARTRARKEADSATHRAAGALSSTAQELTSMAQASENPESPVSEVVRQVGQRVDRIANRIEARGYQGVAQDATRWARQNPGAFLLAAVGAGFVVGRIFRSVDTEAMADAVRGNATSDFQTSTPSWNDMQPDPGMYAGSAPAAAPIFEEPPSGGVGTPPVQPLYTEPVPGAQQPPLDPTRPNSGVPGMGA